MIEGTHLIQEWFRNTDEDVAMLATHTLAVDGSVVHNVIGGSGWVLLEGALDGKRIAVGNHVLRYPGKPTECELSAFFYGLVTLKRLGLPVGSRVIIATDSDHIHKRLMRRTIPEDDKASQAQRILYDWVFAWIERIEAQLGTHLYIALMPSYDNPAHKLALESSAFNRASGIQHSAVTEIIERLRPLAGRDIRKGNLTEDEMHFLQEHYEDWYDLLLEMRPGLEKSLKAAKGHPAVMEHIARLDERLQQFLWITQWLAEWGTVRDAIKAAHHPQKRKGRKK